MRKNEWQGSNFTAYIRNRKIIVVLEPGLLLIFFNPTPLPLLNICTQREEIPQLQFDSTIETEFAFPTSVLEDNFWREIPFSVGQVSAIFPAQLPRSPVDKASKIVRVKEIAGFFDPRNIRHYMSHDSCKDCWDESLNSGVLSCNHMFSMEMCFPMIVCMIEKGMIKFHLCTVPFTFG